MEGTAGSLARLWTYCPHQQWPHNYHRGFLGPVDRSSSSFPFDFSKRSGGSPLSLLSSPVILFFTGQQNLRVLVHIHTRKRVWMWKMSPSKILFLILLTTDVQHVHSRENHKIKISRQREKQRNRKRERGRERKREEERGRERKREEERKKKKGKKEKEFFRDWRIGERETHWSGRPPRAGLNFITFGSNLWTCEIYMYIEKNLLSMSSPTHRVTRPVSNSSLETNWSVIHFFHSSFPSCFCSKCKSDILPSASYIVNTTIGLSFITVGLWIGLYITLWNHNYFSSRSLSSF